MNPPQHWSRTPVDQRDSAAIQGSTVLWTPALVPRAPNPTSQGVNGYPILRHAVQVDQALGHQRGEALGQQIVEQGDVVQRKSERVW